MSRGHDGLVALSGAPAAALLAALLAAIRWAEPAAIRLSATTAMAWQVPGFALDEFVVAYPHLWLLSSLLLGGIGRTVTAAGQALLAASAIGLALALWYGLLRRFGWPAPWAILLTALCLAHPFSRWIVSRSGMDSVALLAASILVVVLARLARGFEPRHLVVLALVLGAGLLLDPRWALHALVLIPCLPFLVGRAWLDASAPGVLIVTLVPVLGALIFFASVGWIFGGQPLGFLFAGSLLLDGGVASAGSLDGLGGGPAAAGSALLWLLTGTPAGALLLGWALWRQRGRRRALVLFAALLPTAGLVASLALGAGWRGLDFVHVAVASGVLAIALTRRFRSAHVVIGLALVGHCGGWLVLLPLGGERVATWQAALVHAPIAAPFADERALAAFLADGPPTLLDDAQGFPLVAALGADGPLVLPPSPGFASQLILPMPTIAQLAVPAPSRAFADRDRIAGRHPDFGPRGCRATGWSTITRVGGSGGGRRLATPPPPSCVSVSRNRPIGGSQHPGCLPSPARDDAWERTLRRAAGARLCGVMGNAGLLSRTRLFASPAPCRSRWPSAVGGVALRPFDLVARLAGAARGLYR